MSHLKKEVVEDLEQAVRDNEERQRKEQLMASTLQKLNADDMLSEDDIEHVSKSGIISVPKGSPGMSIPETIVSTFTSPAKPSSSETSDQQATEAQEPSKPYEETSKVFDTFGNQYWD